MIAKYEWAGRDPLEHPDDAPGRVDARPGPSAPGDVRSREGVAVAASVSASRQDPRMLVPVRLYPFEKTSDVRGEHPTFHEALGSCRVAPRGATLISGGVVLAVARETRWELRDEGISRLQEELDVIPRERNRR
jgi:hypothetical protein